MRVGRHDRIELRGLRVLARCGTLAYEQTHDQPIEIDIDLVCDLQTPGRSDDLHDTVDYAGVCDVVEEAARREHAALLEHLAERIAGAILDHDARIAYVTVGLRKLRPLITQHVATAGIRIERPGS